MMKKKLSFCVNVKGNLSKDRQHSSTFTEKKVLETTILNGRVIWKIFQLFCRLPTCFFFILLKFSQDFERFSPIVNGKSKKDVIKEKS